MKNTTGQLRQIIREEVALLEKKHKNRKLKKSAKSRHRGTVVFDDKDADVKDDKDHFPINKLAQARNALARASQYKKNPKWHKGSLTSLVKKVQRKVKAEFPSIETSPASAKPGKG